MSLNYIAFIFFYQHTKFVVFLIYSHMNFMVTPVPWKQTFMTCFSIHCFNYFFFFIKNFFFSLLIFTFFVFLILKHFFQQIVYFGIESIHEFKFISCVYCKVGTFVILNFIIIFIFKIDFISSFWFKMNSNLFIIIRIHSLVFICQFYLFIK